MSDTLFTDLNLSAPILKALKEVGYETPSPIQASTIPHLLENRDVLGTAQTGTGKTAAFALPILSRIDIKQAAPQALVLAPTRELAIQVAEAFQRYATHIPKFHVLPIYGGQSYGPQLQALRRGVHVVVGTPGRVIDHLEKGSLDLSQLKTWCWTKRTRCCAWASSRTSSASCRKPLNRARPRCSRPPCRPRSSASPPPT